MLRRNLIKARVTQEMIRRNLKKSRIIQEMLRRNLKKKGTDHTTNAKKKS